MFPEDVILCQHSFQGKCVHSVPYRVPVNLIARSGSKKCLNAIMERVLLFTLNKSCGDRNTQLHSEPNRQQPGWGKGGEGELFVCLSWM